MFIRRNICAALFMLVVVVPIAYMAFDNEVPFERFSGEIRPDNPRAGQMIQVIWEGHTKRRCVGVVFRWITDSEGVIWALGETPVVGNDLEHEGVTYRAGKAFRLPTKMAAGPALYRSIVRSHCNRLQRWFNWPIVYTSPEIPFTVSAPHE